MPRRKPNEYYRVYKKETEKESKIGKRKREEKDGGDRRRHLESKGEMIEAKTPKREAGRLEDREREREGGSLLSYY